MPIMGASMRSRLLGLAIIVTLLLNIWGAEATFARDNSVPACCLRAAHPMHCHGLDTKSMASQPVVQTHFHSGTYFVADHPTNCNCRMGFAPASAAIPLPGNTSVGGADSLALTLAATSRLAILSSSIRIHGDRAPPTA